MGCDQKVLIGVLPSPKKCKRVHSAGKVIVSIFLDSQGVIMIDYLEEGRTITGAYYAGVLRRLSLCHCCITETHSGT